MKPNLQQIVLASCLCAAPCSAAETPSAALLVLNKGDNTLAIVDPVAANVIARLPSGPDPHEVVASKGLAYISNYGGNNTLSVVDLVRSKGPGSDQPGSFAFASRFVGCRREGLFHGGGKQDHWAV